MMRTDRHKNPVAATTDVSRAGGLIGGIDFNNGDSFQVNDKTLYTALFLGDPIDLSIKLITNATFYTRDGHQRWSYIAIPPFLWNSLSQKEKIQVIFWMYKREGGAEMETMFKERLQG
jgi:hypothetical protein